MQVELQASESLACMEECVNEDVKEKEKSRRKRGHFTHVLYV